MDKPLTCAWCGKPIRASKRELECTKSLRTIGAKPLCLGCAGRLLPSTVKLGKGWRFVVVAMVGGEVKDSPPY